MAGIEATVDGTSLSKTVVGALGGLRGRHVREHDGQLQRGVSRARSADASALPWDRVLLYGTGGVAITSFNTNYFDTTGFFTGVPGTNTTISNTRAGFTFGGGIEYAVTDNWSVRAEYRYSNFGHISDYPFTNPNNFVLPAGGYVVAQHYLNESQVQVGFSYRFDMMVPPPPLRRLFHPHNRSSQNSAPTNPLSQIED